MKNCMITSSVFFFKFFLVFFCYRVEYFFLYVIKVLVAVRIFFMFYAFEDRNNLRTCLLHEFLRSKEFVVQRNDRGRNFSVFVFEQVFFFLVHEFLKCEESTNDIVSFSYLQEKFIFSCSIVYFAIKGISPVEGKKC